MIIDRSKIPNFKEISEVNLIDYELKQLSCGVPVYIFNAGSQDVVSVELLFDAGSCKQPKPLVASCTSAILREGTSSYNSHQISESIDFYGAYLQTDVDKDSASVALYALNKQLDNVLPYLSEVLANPTFPKEELETHLVRLEQKYLLDQEKNSSLARQEFLNALYGNTHPYGKKMHPKFFKELQQVDLVNFWKENYTAKNCIVFLSGKVTEEVFNAIDKAISLPNNKTENKIKLPVVEPSSQWKHYVEKPKSVQSAIRIGKRTIGKSHPDFVKLQVVNTILGGYFGSRLMSNIREDKGYTYGIGSFVAVMKHDSYFGISTEVGVDVTKKTLDEIYKELNKLRTELVPEEELMLVKSYLMGELLKSVDGPFAVSERWKGLILFGLSKKYFDDLVKTIATITPQEIIKIANKYLQSNDMYEVVVGMK